MDQKKRRNQRDSFEYRGYTVERCSPNAYGLRWEAFGTGGLMRADTQSGIKELIREDLSKIVTEKRA